MTQDTTGHSGDQQSSPVPVTLLSPIVERAFRFAARAHRDHFRKKSDLPYVVHPAAVAMVLQKVGIDDPEILAAALLHDTVEDTDASIDDIAREFSPRVVRLVDAVTEEKRDGDGHKRTWEQRKQSHIDDMVGAEDDVCAVVLADKLHNLFSMLYDLQQGEELWSKFGAPKHRVEWYHRSMIAAVERDDKHLQVLAGECRNVLDAVMSFNS